MNKIQVGHDVLFIGDLHGLSGWEDLCTDGLKHFYKIVFLGDYVDSFYIKAVEQLYNLKKLCTFIRKNKSQVTALLGNHDYAYIYGYSGISGHQYYHIQEYKKIFDDNMDLFDIAWGYTNLNTKKYTLATHAGLTKTFWNKFLIPAFEKNPEHSFDTPIDKILNNFKNRGDILWKVGSMRGGNGTPGPLWADYMEILDDPYEEINQVFGHTPQVTPRLDYFGNNFIACIDNWGNKKVVSLLLTL